MIDENPRTTDRKEEIKDGLQSKRYASYKTAQDIRYNERSTIERVNGRLKDEFGARMVRVRGHVPPDVWCYRPTVDQWLI